MEINIKADNIGDFEQKYLDNIGRGFVEDITVNLETTDSFWQELTTPTVENSLPSFNFLTGENIKLEPIKFKSVHLPKYGRIIRV